VSIHSTRSGAAQKITGSPKGQTPSLPIKYAPLSDWFVISGVRRTRTYELLALGLLRAIKLNNRTLIDVEHGLAYLATLPTARITTGRNRRAQAVAAEDRMARGSQVGPER